ncbi:MAG: aldolase/citrate lyase family protein [Planctomycetota bacterium]
MGIQSIRRRARDGEILVGTWLVLGSSLTAEIAGNSGFDWVVLDMEHGMGANDSLLFQLQALSGTPASPIVRVAQNDPVLIKRALDLGPAGIMAPMVSTAEDAQRVVRAMRYPPQGIRGVTPYTRPADFGRQFKEYFASANDELICLVQIETEEAVNNADEIAAVDGVDVLFIGPLDLTVGLGIMKEFGHPKYRAAVEKIVSACRKAGKVPGIILLDVEVPEETVADGFTFIGRASDGSILAAALSELVEPFAKFKKPSKT